MRLIWLGLIGGKHSNKVEQDPIVYQLYISCFSSQPSAFTGPVTARQLERPRNNKIGADCGPFVGDMLRHNSVGAKVAKVAKVAQVAPGVAMVAMSFPFQKSLVIHMSI